MSDIASVGKAVKLTDDVGTLIEICPAAKVPKITHTSPEAAAALASGLYANGVDEPRQPEPVLARIFEFRLAGSEEQRQTFSLPGHIAKRCVAATRSIRVYLTGSGDASASMSGIGAVEVEVAVCGLNLTCAARIADFRVSDLVVVEVDTAVFAVRIAALGFSFWRIPRALQKEKSKAAILAALQKGLP